MNIYYIDIDEDDDDDVMPYIILGNVGFRMYIIGLHSLWECDTWNSFAKWRMKVNMICFRSVARINIFGENIFSNIIQRGKSELVGHALHLSFV